MPDKHSLIKQERYYLVFADFVVETVRETSSCCFLSHIYFNKTVEYLQAKSLQHSTEDKIDGQFKFVMYLL